MRKNIIIFCKMSIILQAKILPQYRVIALGKHTSEKYAILNYLSGKHHFTDGASSILSSKSLISNLKNNPSSKILLELVDTPGFFDSTKDDSETFTQISYEVHKICGSTQRIVSFICVQEKDFFSENAIKAYYKMFKNALVGIEHLKIVIIVTKTKENQLSDAKKYEIQKICENTLMNFLVSEKKLANIHKEVIFFENESENLEFENFINTVFIREPLKNPLRKQEDFDNYLKNSEQINKVAKILSSSYKNTEALKSSLNQAKMLLELKNVVLSKSVNSQISDTRNVLIHEFRTHKAQIATMKTETLVKLKQMKFKIDEKNRIIEDLQNQIKQAKKQRNLSLCDTQRRNFSKEKKSESRPSSRRPSRCDEEWKLIKTSPSTQVPHKLKKRDTHSKKQSGNKMLLNTSRIHVPK